MSRPFSCELSWYLRFTQGLSVSKVTYRHSVFEMLCNMYGLVQSLCGESLTVRGVCDPSMGVSESHVCV